MWYGEFYSDLFGNRWNGITGCSPERRSSICTCSSSVLLIISRLMDLHILQKETTLSNPHWEYSRNKNAPAKSFLMKLYRENGFPVTIIRPSHTSLDERNDSDWSSWEIKEASRF